MRVSYSIGIFLPILIRFCKGTGWNLCVFLSTMVCGSGVFRKVCFHCVCGGVMHGFTENVMFWHGAGVNEVQSVQGRTGQY